MKAVWLVPGLALLAVAALDEESGLARWTHLRAELADADVRIGVLEREVSALRREAVRLESEPFAIERAIREELELARPGQQVIRLPGSKASSDWNP
ncbi:MAG: septum formation initiator family protein [Deltaproteobacteria bacterium]|nr:septum formation initiator family protein [Deltaproteobacteria bacterium]MBW2360483.1 septum formation initiator family protein [Deltaproteobacteria bacterium]